VIRTIFAKIFFWFWIATAAVTASVLLITLMGGAQPLGRRWLSHSLDFYARSAVDFYTHGGALELQKYLDDIEQSSAIRATLLDPQGKDVLGRGLPPGTERVLAWARKAGESRFHTGLAWTGASLVHTPRGDFILVARVYPLRGFWHEPSFPAALLRTAIALISAGLLCWLIARHITAPVRALQTAARRIANGELSVRATPNIPPRNDELADLAHDFDRMADRIQSLLRKQQELLGDVSHELRSPLARLSVSLELIRRGDHDAVERMQVDLDQLDRLIGQLLTLTRLQLRDGRDMETAFNLRKIVESVTEDAGFEGNSSEKFVVITRADDCLMTGDPALVRSCIENVARNAVRYTRPQTSVEISLVFQKGVSSMADVTVLDRGPGVPSETLPHLFEAFYRVSEARDRESGGAGLGLSIAQRVVTLHGGTIAAKNREGGGLAVDIRLPAKSN
jgi:two-component system, OmpR family, sensor histidine kinase CpxA